jgi:hypothetical protein
VPRSLLNGQRVTTPAYERLRTRVKADTVADMRAENAQLRAELVEARVAQTEVKADLVRLNAQVAEMQRSAADIIQQLRGRVAWLQGEHEEHTNDQQVAAAKLRDATDLAERRLQAVYQAEAERDRALAEKQDLSKELTAAKRDHWWWLGSAAFVVLSITGINFIGRHPIVEESASAEPAASEAAPDMLWTGAEDAHPHMQTCEEEAPSSKPPALDVLWIEDREDHVVVHLPTANGAQRRATGEQPLAELWGRASMVLEKLAAPGVRGMWVRLCGIPVPLDQLERRLHNPMFLMREQHGPPLIFA